MNLFDIKGKKAIVTGGSRGLGYGMAEGLMEAGCETVIIGVSDRVFRTAQEFRERGLSCQAVRADLGDREEMEPCFKKAVELLGGRLDILVTAHGIQSRHRSEEFPLEEINKLYLMRWSEETSFRELKYTIGLINWHSSKYDGILQEINAHMILYNFCELVTSHAMVKKSKNTKHVYKINFAIAVNICRAYLKHSGNETETMLLIQKYLTPVRYNRKYPIPPPSKEK